MPFLLALQYRAIVYLAHADHHLFGKPMTEQLRHQHSTGRGQVFPPAWASYFACHHSFHIVAVSSLQMASWAAPVCPNEVSTQVDGHLKLHDASGLSQWQTHRHRLAVCLLPGLCCVPQRSSLHTSCRRNCELSICSHGFWKCCRASHQ